MFVFVCLFVGKIKVK